MLCAPALAQEPTAAQPELPTITMTVTGHGGQPHPFVVEQATTPMEQETGLMFRTRIAADHGMLFDFGAPTEQSMWMKNTLIPLDMLFVNQDGTIRRIAEDTAPESLSFINSDGPIRAVIELQGGITEKLDIRVGDKVRGGIFK